MEPMNSSAGSLIELDVVSKSLTRRQLQISGLALSWNPMIFESSLKQKQCRVARLEDQESQEQREHREFEQLGNLIQPKGS